MAKIIRYNEFINEKVKFDQKIYDEYVIYQNLKTVYGIKNFTINKDGTIDVYGDVDLSEKGLEQIPFKFGKVTGKFLIYSNRLKTLEGCPYYVGDFFSCHHNNLTNLIGGPQEVKGDYCCSNNKLKTLEGAPEEVIGEFDCRYNELASLEFAPAEIDGDLDCSRNEFLIKINCVSNIKGNLNCLQTKIDPDNMEFYGHVNGRVFMPSGHSVNINESKKELKSPGDLLQEMLDNNLESVLQSLYDEVENMIIRIEFVPLMGFVLPMEVFKYYLNKSTLQYDLDINKFNKTCIKFYKDNSSYTQYKNVAKGENNYIRIYINIGRMDYELKEKVLEILNHASELGYFIYKFNRYDGYISKNTWLKESIVPNTNKIYSDFDPPQGLLAIKKILSKYSIDKVIRKISNEFGYEKRKIKYLGAGSYGAAFEILGKNKVIKLTLDESEAINAERLLKRNTTYLINYYDVREIDFDTNEEREKIFAIVMDKMKPISYEYKEYIETIMNEYYEIGEDYELLIPDEVIKKVHNEYVDIKIDILSKIVHDLNDIISEMIKVLKIKSVGQLDIHSDNIGVNRQGHLVYYDITDQESNKEFKRKRKAINLNENKFTNKPKAETKIAEWLSPSEQLQQMLDDNIESLITSLIDFDPKVRIRLEYTTTDKMSYMAVVHNENIGTTNKIPTSIEFGKNCTNTILESRKRKIAYTKMGYIANNMEGNLSLIIISTTKIDKKYYLEEVDHFMEVNNYTLYNQSSGASGFRVSDPYQTIDLTLTKNWTK